MENRNEVIVTQILLQENKYYENNIEKRKLREFFIKGNLSISTYRNYIEVLRVLEYIRIENTKIIFSDNFLACVIRE